MSAKPVPIGITVAGRTKEFFLKQDEGIRFQAGSRRNLGGDGVGAPGEEFKARVAPQEAARVRTRRSARGRDGPGL